MTTEFAADSRPADEKSTSGAGSDTTASRAAFLKRAGVGGAVLVGGSALLGSFAGQARAGDPGDGVHDQDVLNYALTLEYLEAEFYTQALGGAGTTGVPASPGKFSQQDLKSSGALMGEGRENKHDAYDLLGDIRDHEVAHVDFLLSALGGAAVGPCTFDFSSALASVQSFLSTAQVLENTGVMAYDGAIRYVNSGDILQAGAQIATVEARHAAFLNLITDVASPFPSAFDMGKKPSEIYAAISPFVVSCPPEVIALFSRLP